jgi:hypothetical protein
VGPLISGASDDFGW